MVAVHHFTCPHCNEPMGSGSVVGPNHTELGDPPFGRNARVMVVMLSCPHCGRALGPYAYERDPGGER
jgi:transcription elongation factor Elf1